MLFVAILYWEGSMNTFHLRYGMVTTTLFDITSITSLQPTGETFNLTLLTSTEPTFDFDRATYKIFYRSSYLLRA